jgi:hypothetical protein
MGAAGDRHGYAHSHARSDAALLACAALAHASAGERCASEHGSGGATPMAVANALQQLTLQQT